MKNFTLLLTIIILSFSLIGCSKDSSSKIPQYSRDDIPDAEQVIDIPWETSTPEEQGMDSQLLYDMFEFIQTNDMPIHNVLIIRNDYIVCDAYFHPFKRTTKHNLFSATKSFTSTLIGIAIDEVKLEGVSVKVSDVLTEIQMPNNDLGTKDMTINDLLTMSAGHTNDSSNLATSSNNFAQDFFDQPFSEAPGTKFFYDSGASHLLSHILTRATGESNLEYIINHIFEPLNITDYSWDITDYSWDTIPQKVNAGGWGLHLTPYSMAKFGYMALNNGEYYGNHIVSSDWIKEASQKHIDNSSSGYGYQWWQNSFGGYRADGFAGQYIFVLPEYNMTAVITGGFNGSEPYSTFDIMENYIIESIKSENPLLDNNDSYEALCNIVEELETPTPQAVDALPEIAERVSQKIYKMNSLFNEISFDFSNKEACTVTISQFGNTQELKIGLDEVYKVTKATRLGTLPWYPDYESIALKGHWEDGNTFIMDWQYVGEPYQEEYQFTFKEDELILEVREYVVKGAGPLEGYATYQGKIAE